MANNAIKRPYVQIPTMSDIVNKLQGAERFTKLDLKEAYHQIVLSESSRHITTFYGPDGLYRYKRLNYGTKSAQDILQTQMQKMLSGIPHQVNIADDILIGGTVDERDLALKQVLSVLKNRGITLNPILVANIITLLILNHNATLTQQNQRSAFKSAIMKIVCVPPEEAGN